MPRLPCCPPATEASNRPRVVIADDNADMRQYLTCLLSERYDVVSVADGNLRSNRFARRLRTWC